jgi:hypothetical protein
MSLPTSGYTTTDIVYSVAVNNIPFHIDVKVNVNDVGGESEAEAIAAILDSSLVNLANDLEALPGAGSGVVFKQFIGSTSNTNIA